MMHYCSQIFSACLQTKPAARDQIHRKQYKQCKKVNPELEHVSEDKQN